MNRGDLVWVKPVKACALIVEVHEPTIRFPAEMIDVIFFDGVNQPSSFYARSIQVIDENWRPSTSTFSGLA